MEIWDLFRLLKCSVAKEEDRSQGVGYSMYNYFNQSSLIQVIVGKDIICRDCKEKEDCFKKITYFGNQEDYEKRIRKFKCKLME